MIFGIHSSFLRLNALIFAIVFLYACNPTPQKDLSFYHPKRVLEKHSYPVYATLKNGNVLEDVSSFVFEGEEKELDFRFGIAYFSAAPNDNSSIEQKAAIEIKNSIISTSLLLEKNTIYTLKHHLYIANGASLILEEGSQLYIADGVDIISKGNIEVSGNKENPVLITALDEYWGGISSYGGEINIQHLILTQSGGNDSIKVRHSYSQPAIYMIYDGEFNASNLYISNCLGKALFIKGSYVDIKKSLFADCDTGPEINWSKVEMDSIICMNIPDSKDGEDDDNDALYIFGRHRDFLDISPKISNVLLGFAKDDGFDHGKNDMEVNNLLVYKVKDKAISLEGGAMKLNNVWLSDARVLLGVKQDTHAQINTIYLSKDGQRSDILENMQQDPTLDIKTEIDIVDKAKTAEAFWFSVFE